ncbi:hypothetical protein [Cupriavidus taiwanensis]|uniref:hypothetical protein n=1 Tax=Cupriavidus taiwanensis TaxID=164546 RepID=UPI0011AE52F4|nr:hypothetical protein [Cupriavidus taiwanensis]
MKELPRWMDGSVFPINAPAHHKAFKGHANGPDWSIFHWHDLRHTAITRLATKLPNLIERAAVSRHRSLTMLKRYYHPSAAELAEKMLSGPAVRKGIGDSMSFLIDLICTAKKNPPKRVGGSERSKGD